MKKLSLAMCVSLLAIPAVLAGPLQRKQVAADPIWLVHADVDRFKQTRLGQFILGELAKPEAQAKLAAFQAVFNFDPRTNLSGLTLYGGSVKPEDGVLLVHGTFDTARLDTIAKGAEAYQTQAHRKYAIDSWVDDKQKSKPEPRPRTYAAFHSNKLLVFGQKAERVADALDVLDQVKPGLGGSKLFPEPVAPLNRYSLWAATRRVELPETDPNAAVLKNTQYASLTAAETDQHACIEVALEANSEEVAKQIHNIALGLHSLLSMQTGNPEHAKFVQAISIALRGSTVGVTLKLPIDDGLKLLKAETEKRAAQEAQESKESKP